MMRIGGFFVCIVRICTGLVCVRSSSRDPSGCGREIERIVLLSRRMLGRDIEASEVQLVRLDIRTFGNLEPHVGEDLDAFVEHLADGMNAAVEQGARPHGQRHVGPLGRKPLAQRRAVEHVAARIERLRDAALQRIDRLPERLALLRRQRPELRHQLGHTPLLAERLHAHLIELRQIAGPGDLSEQFGLQLGKIGGGCCSRHGRPAS